MIGIFKRELKSYFENVSGFLFIAFLLFIVGIYTFAYNFSAYYSNFEYALSSASLFAYLFSIPVLTMKSIAEDKRQGTDKLLYSLPIGTADILFGKFLALGVVMLIPTAVFCIYPLILSKFGTVNFVSAYGGILCFFLLGLALLSIGFFMSSVTDNQLIALALTLGTILLLYFMEALSQMIPKTSLVSAIAFVAVSIIVGVIVFLMTKSFIVSSCIGFAGIIATLFVFKFKPIWLEGRFQKVISSVAAFNKMDNFIGGLFDVTAIIYYLSFIGVFLAMTYISLEKKRWS